MSVFNNGVEILKIMHNGLEIDMIMHNGVEIFAKAGGASFTNAIMNGSAIDGMNWWSFDGVAGSTNDYYSSPKSFLQTNEEQYAYQAISGTIGDKFYFSCMAKHISGEDALIWASEFGGWGDQLSDTTVLTDTWEKLSMIYTTSSAGMRAIVAPYGGNIACENYYDDVMVVNLTELYGSESEPDLSWCNANISYTETSPSYTNLLTVGNDSNDWYGYSDGYEGNITPNTFEGSTITAFEHYKSGGVTYIRINNPVPTETTLRVTHELDSSQWDLIWDSGENEYRIYDDTDLQDLLINNVGNNLEFTLELI